ncbi:MAG: hypothetical protein MJ211_10005 [Bacteroidales bacterium]|nr:hypothetical protein [Bacteroidales bacterium]
MAQTYDLNQSIITSTAAQFEKRLENELVIGKLAKTELKSGAKMGDEVNVIMPAEVALTKWDGGDLSAPEKIKSGIVKVEINQGYVVNFELEKAKELQITSASNDVAAKLIDEYSSDAMYKAKDRVDAYLGGLYGLAGHVEDNSGSAISLTADTADKAFTILSNVKAKLSRFNAWKTGKMLAILPPEMISLMLGMSFNVYTEGQVKDRAIGELSQKVGFKILESNNVAITGSGVNTVYHPLFGVEGETFAAPLQKGLELVSYMRDESLNKAFKGAFVFGGNCPNSKKLATANVKVTLGSY